ncbi:hypothetical protein D3Z36_08120 [Lachnospiraceae bacterium]|nr:hypothetical protein [Lachnospiraceae bacterium]
MQERIYHIFMYTPLGKKPGILAVKSTGHTISGWLEILNHNKPIEGTVDEVGNCKIFGSFVTSIRTVTFVAAGKISESSIWLQVKEDRNVFELSGTSHPEEVAVK